MDGTTWETSIRSLASQCQPEAMLKPASASGMTSVPPVTSGSSRSRYITSNESGVSQETRGASQKLPTRPDCQDMKWSIPSIVPSMALGSPVVPEVKAM